MYLGVDIEPMHDFKSADNYPVIGDKVKASSKEIDIGGRQIDINVLEAERKETGLVGETHFKQMMDLM